MEQMVTRTRLVVGAVALLAVIVVSVAPGATGGDRQATVSGVKKKLKKVTRKVTKLQAQVDQLQGQLAALQGEQGGPRPPSGPAGGALAGSYPDPSIAANAVGSAQMQADAVGSEKIAANAVGSEEIADAAVDRPEIAVAAVGPSELGGLTVFSDTVALAAGANSFHTTSCPAGFGGRMVSGGALGNDSGLDMVASRPEGNGWQAWFQNPTASASSYTVYVNCLQ